MTTQVLEAVHENLKLKHLQTQLEGWNLMHTFLDTMRQHHLLCAEFSHDVEAARIHIEIANLINQTRDQYRRLIKINRPHSG